MTPRVLVVHNFPTRYRLPLFERLADEVRLEVWFCGRQEQGRRVSEAEDVDLKGVECAFLPHFMIGSFVLNWSVLRMRDVRLFDAVILAEEPHTTLASAGIAFWCRIHRVPLVLWTERVRGNGRRTRTRRSRLGVAAYRAFRRLLLRMSVAVIALSGRAGADELRASGIGATPIIEGRQIMPLDLMPAAFDGPHRPADRVSVLFLGYLRPVKNVGELIGAFAAAAQPDQELVIAGDGPLREVLTDAAAAHPAISFVGHVSGRGKDAAFAASDVLVVPSTYEPWGLVINESLYSGTPVIADVTVGAAELVRSGQTGLLYGPGCDYPDLRSALEAYLRDPALRATLADGAASADKRPLYDLENGVEAMLDAIHLAVRRQSS